MLKRNLIILVTLAAAVACAFLFSACGGAPAKETEAQTSSETETETETETDRPTSAVSGTEAEPAETARETSPGTAGSAVAKINGDADEAGIYSITVRLTDRAADKGVVELVYYGEKGSPQENSVVNRFRIEYDKDTSGTFEIRTFFDGEVYINYHKTTEVKVTNTISATLRAGNVIIFYTPDGGETEEIFRADAAYFR